MRLIWLICLFLLAFARPGFGQKYTFITYSTEEGLPQSQVSSMVQDSLGYLWVGTLGGLARFNGEEFVTFSTQNGLVNNRISHLEWIDNELWIGHDGGVSVYSKGKFRKYLFSGMDKSRNVSDIIKFKGKVYICSNGGGLFVLKNDKLDNVALPNVDHLRIRQALVFEDHLYLATRDGILSTKNGEAFKIDKRFERYSYSGLFVANGMLHLTTFTDGYLKYNLKTNQKQLYPFELFGKSLYSAYSDKEGKIWFKTTEGISILDNDGSVKVIDSKSGLPLDMISCFYQDRDGTMWIGSQGKGFFRFAGELFVYYDQATGLLSDFFFTGFQNANGDLYLGSFDNGLIKKNRAGKVENVNIGEMTIWCALPNIDGFDWFGAQSGLIGLRDDKKIIYREEDGLPGGKITALYRLNSHEMLVGGSDGVSVYNSGKFKRYKNSTADYLGTVRDFCIIDGDIYCVSNLGVFKLVNNQFEPLLKDRVVVYNIEADSQNAVWYGTEEGLFRISDKGTERISLLDDPGSNFINFLNYKSGKIYVGTNNGMYILTNLSAKEPTFTRYGISEGIVDLETNLNSSFFDREGNLWFGTAKGLIKFDIRQQKKKLEKPLIRMFDLQINYDHVDYSMFSDQRDDFGIPLNLELPYNKNNLIFHFDAVSLGNHRGVRFQYFLKGLSEEWSPLSAISTISFTSLPSGDYTLLVRAVDVDGTRSNEYEIPILINQAYYKTWWFICLMAALVAGIMFLIFRSRIQRIQVANEKERLEFKTRLLDLEQKSVNASMNRHFIFNALNSIQYFINTQDRRSANKYLTNFAQLIRKNLDSANSDENKITLEEELDRIRLYLSLEEMRFTGKFRSEISVDDVELESVQIPAMILQPFVENSIIHGILPSDRDDGLISIHVSHHDSYVFIRIEDNGIGINKSLASKSEMLGDHRSQGMEISAKRVEIIRAITKEDISLEGPIEIEDSNGSVKGTYVLLKIPYKILED